MSPALIVLIALAGAFFVLIAFMILRALLTKPIEVQRGEYQPIKVNKERIAKKLSQAVQIPTLTVLDESMSYQPFLDFHNFLEKAFPKIHSIAQRTIINNYSLIYKIEGTDPSLKPGCFLAHQDVVPAPPEGWEVHPFSGAIKDGYVYGRGSQDMKGQMIAALEAMEILLENNFKPRRTIYFCFGHDEEFTGKEGAKNIASYLEKNNIQMEFVLDEGGTVLDGSIIGVKGMLALIGTCEKGYVDIQLKAKKPGGHASTPFKRNAVDLLSEAVYDVAITPMKRKWSTPAKDMMKAIAPNMKFLYKFLFVNRDILSPLLKWALGIANPVTDSLLKTTFAPTQLKGADAPNVLPPEATATINCRINIGESSEKVLNHIKKVVGKNIEVSVLPGKNEPSPVSDIISDAYKTLTKTINEVFEDFLPAPYPFIAATDAKFYYNVSNNVYRFTPFLMSEDDRTRIHAINERQEINGLVKATQFFARFIENSCG
ncbi:MAG: M20/M25/M40 family metallo-hydrolase [Bacillota bacterium]|jgi:carboxypeptidase PM20D1|nr:M20/M25/M40 family metallo-hydrolase [Bacillota bacterium]HHU43817.1 M20/M25/M40 family metallo-hydrolase [Clostridiales bacterium]